MTGPIRDQGIAAATSTDAAVVDLIAAIVRGDWVGSSTLAGCDPDTICRLARDHGVLPLVAERLAARIDGPLELPSRLRSAAKDEAAADLLREMELRRLLVALDRAGVDGLLIKGAHLAYCHYARPDLRSRVDTDLLIRTTARASVHEILVRLGYGTKAQVAGELAMRQRSYVKRRADFLVHAVDVHWAIANSEVFAGVLSFEELSATAVPLPRLSPAARGLSDVHALLLACVHRVAHHRDAECLIWLYDIHLVARNFGPGEWKRFMELAVERRVAAVCRTSLHRTVQRFGTNVPAQVWAGLSSSGGIDGEVSAGYLVPGRRRVDEVVDDLRALRTWADRWRLVREHVFPPAQYIRSVYAPASVLPLPFLYAGRVFRGLRKWLWRPGRPRIF